MRRLVAAGLAAASVVALGVSGVAAAPGWAAETATTDSAMTAEGIGPFSDLRVTVDQTQNLIDQVVRISWSGAPQTKPGSGQYAINYLQIMQCWGDDPSGPRREQCQYGGLTGDLRGGAWSASRQVSYGRLIDPNETLKQPAGSFTPRYVPFESVTGVTKESATSEFFDANTTNEVPFAVSRADGTGQDFFPVQTVRDAPGLGCGEPVTSKGTTKGRSCWLVIVPRNDREVDGSVRTISSSSQLNSSPLSASNWQYRMVFPLSFEPVGRPCPLGQEERLTAGQENVAEAIVRWQPALCADGGAVYGYSQVSDDVARRQLRSTDPGLVFISKPEPVSDRDPERKVLYAAVAVSGLAVAFNIESVSPARAPADIKARDGQRITELNLTPRLVAKLVTASYTRAVPQGAESVKGNPSDLTKDPEFIAINPQFDGLSLSLADALLPSGRSDIAELLWTWLTRDRDAKAFLSGDADPWGMRVNASFAGTDVPRSDYPKTETHCQTFLDARPPLCTFDAYPYVADMKDGAKSAARGDTQARSVWEPAAVPPAWKKGLPQPSGNRAIIAITDSASAERYDLDTAALRNAAGEFVRPTAAAMSAAVDDLPTDTGTGVRLADPGVSDPKAYPLSTITYAATVPSALDRSERLAYAALLDFAAGPGQRPGVVPGTLPFGYAPLPQALAAETTAAAKVLRAEPSTESAEPVEPEESTVGSIDTAPPIPPGEVLPSDASVPAADAAASAAATGTGTVTSALAALATPFESLGWARALPMLLLVLGLGCAVAGPLLVRRAGGL